MFTKLILGSLLVLMSPAVMADFAQVKLECVSASGKTKLEAIIPGDSDETRVSVNLDALTPNSRFVHYLNRAMIESQQENDRDASEEFPLYRESIISTVNPENIKALTVSVLEFDEYNMTVLTLVARSETLRLERTGLSIKGTFEAELLGPRDPRHEGFSSPELLMCSYDYSI